MGKKYLIDSNVIIDFCNGKLSLKGKDLLLNIEPEISIITQIELFASKNISIEEHTLLEKFSSICVVHSVNADLVDTTINLRQNYKIKLPDAIIAATALCKNLGLISNNVSDFKKIRNLEVINPYGDFNAI